MVKMIKNYQGWVLFTLPLCGLYVGIMERFFNLVFLMKVRQEYGEVNGLVRDLLEIQHTPYLVITLLMPAVIISTLYDVYGPRRCLAIITAFMTTIHLAVYLQYLEIIDKPIMLIYVNLFSNIVSPLTLLLVYTAGEYTTPKLRPYVIILTAFVFNFVGLLLTSFLKSISNELLYVNSFGAVLAIAVSGLTFCWTDSPVWLASEGKIEKADESYRKLHEWDQDCEVLKDVESRKNVNYKQTNYQMFAVIVRKLWFWKVCLYIALFFTFRLNFDIINYCFVSRMSTDISSIQFGVIIAASLTLMAVIYKFDNRVVLLAVALVSILLCILSYMFLLVLAVDIGSILMNVLVIVYMFSVSYITMPIISCYYSEIIPHEMKPFSFYLHVIVFSTQGLAVSALQGFMRMHFFYPIIFLIISVELYVVYFVMPETKNVSLQEIEMHIKDEINEDETCDIRVCNDDAELNLDNED